MTKVYKIEKIRARSYQNYERGRLLYALKYNVCMFPFLLVLFLISTQHVRAFSAIILLWIFSFFAFWRGLELEKGVFPGMLCGLFPMASSQIAVRFGHICLGQGCVFLCAPLCTAGGFLSGLVVALWFRHCSRPFVAFFSSSIFVLCVGITGCSCVGWVGISGTMVGQLFGYSFLFLFRTQR